MVLVATMVVVVIVVAMVVRPGGEVIQVNLS